MPPIPFVGILLLVVALILTIPLSLFLRYRALGGNFALCTPDLPYTAEALRKCQLTVQVSTKLNRSHLVHGKRALILPCLARTDKDHQASGFQGVTVEDAMSMVHISYGMKEPGSPHQRSECAILAGMAQATLPGSRTAWRQYVENYDRIRDTMAPVLEGLEDFNRRARHPHGFRIAQPARDRIFKTATGRAEFSAAPLPTEVNPGEGWLLLGRSGRTISSTRRSIQTTTAIGASRACARLCS